ncbi:MAG: cupin domain-containing protein [Candidatus Thorarchaeota archaeon]|jgi:mannose-6-phosphate isomerase-like protein (cupin superfamily)
MRDHPNITRLVDQIVVDKSWGYEVWVANSELYCGKALVIEPSCETSLHFHIKKTEHIFVHDGIVIVTILEDSKTTKYALEEGDSILITPGMVHRLRADYNQKAVLYEFSTEHFEDDSYRVEQ